MMFADPAPVCRAVAECAAVIGILRHFDYRVEYVDIVTSDAIDAGLGAWLY